MQDNPQTTYTTIQEKAFQDQFISCSNHERVWTVSQWTTSIVCMSQLQRPISGGQNNTAERLKVCVNCLSHAHFVQDCTSTRLCKYCGCKHHTMLHRQKSSGQGDFNRAPVQQPQPQQQPHNTHVALTPVCTAVKGAAAVFLGTCEAIMESKERQQKARALLDSGSHLTFVTTRLAQSLKAKKIREKTSVSGFAHQEAPTYQFKVDLVLLPHFSCASTPVAVRAVVADSITGDLPGSHLRGVKQQPFLLWLTLADTNFKKPGPNDILTS